jgi:predicted alpha/beta-hydrolase family hydrolase
MPAARARELRVELAGGASVGALLLRPASARWLLVLAHGAGAGMRHPFLESIAAGLAERGMATFRYQFPYMDRGGRSPDARPRLLSTVRAAVAAAGRAAPGLPLLAGGKSMGGRMTSLAVSESGPEAIRGLVFLGFPLHGAGRPSLERGDHLDAVPIPMLFLQGTRDDLADPDLLRRVCGRLGDRATLTFLEGADHSFRVPKRAGADPAAVLEHLAETICDWAAPATGVA